MMCKVNGKTGEMESSCRVNTSELTTLSNCSFLRRDILTLGYRFWKSHPTCWLSSILDQVTGLENIFGVNHLVLGMQYYQAGSTAAFF